MDLSILAAVGSFVVSERLLRPKSLILVGLAGLMLYDLLTKKYDPAGRVYRGPGLIAITLMCGAFCLRQWRRNNVACDELLFLPGTSHGEKHSSSSTLQHFIKRAKISGQTMPITACSNGRIKASGEEVDEMELNSITNAQSEESDVEMSVVLLKCPSAEQMSEKVPQISAVTCEQIHEESSAQLDQHPSQDHENDDSDDDDDDSSMMRSLLNDSKSSFSADAAATASRSLEQRTIIDLDTAEEADGSITVDKVPSSAPVKSDPTPTDPDSDENESKSSSNAESWESDEDGGHYAYSPSGAAVFGASLDLLLPVLFNFHLFISLAANYSGNSSISPKVIPLVFFNVIIFRSIFPRGKRKRFWGTLKYTIMAPFHPVCFRDDFIGDVLTSLARPIQDIAFAVFYYIAIVQASISSSNLKEADTILESSWLLHNFIMPLCAMFPLWLKFLQTLRMCYDTERRMPHMANAFKYLSAALIILYGMAHPENRRSRWWILAFVVATLYQIVWDVIVDWELFILTPVSSHRRKITISDGCAISSVSPSSFCSSLYRLFVQPILSLHWNLHHYYYAVTGYQISLRSTRMFKNESFYWTIFWVNFCLRFCWMLSYIPAYRLSSTGGIEPTFSPEINSYVGVAIALAEIGRRCLWGILRVEIESIKLTDPIYTTTHLFESWTASSSQEQKKNWMSCIWSRIKSESEYESLPMCITQDEEESSDELTSSKKFMLAHMNKLFLVELSMWVIGFVGLGYMMFCLF